jgi:hypothetical protein
MSDTPRTDAARALQEEVERAGCAFMGDPLGSLCEQLEREVAEVQKALGDLLRDARNHEAAMAIWLRYEFPVSMNPPPSTVHGQNERSPSDSR